MTVDEIVKGNEFNLSVISKEVFGSARIISDKNRGNRKKKWLPGDYEKIAEYFEKKYQIKLQLTK